MVDIAMESHEFEKTNPVTIVRGRRAYDEYRCRVCGLEGKRYGFSNIIRVQRDKLNCSHRKRMLTKCVRIRKEDEPNLKNSFGLSADKEYEPVEPPERYKGKYPESVWVFSEKRQEPVRLLLGEFVWVHGGAE
jgi:hypothetical protein